MTFRTLDRAVCLLAAGFASGLSILNAPLVDAAWPQSGELGDGSASQSVAVDELQRILTEDKGKPDAVVARQLSGLVLTERLSDARLASLEQSVPGTQSRSMLVALADASVFLAPAAADVLFQAAPDLSEQRHMIALTVDYLGKTLPKLPNFYATRTTIRYDGDARTVKRGGLIYRDDSSWREVGSSKVVVKYRDGEEVVDPVEGRKRKPHSKDERLITRGTFGPILSTVIVDAAHGEMHWDRWERGDTGKLAVFRYTVPENQSHYSVGFHALLSEQGEPKDATGYHGEVAIDPETGTILRLTVQAELPLGSPIFRGDIMVEYGPVEIGGKTYTCPTRSVSISLTAEGLSGAIHPTDRPTREPNATLLNDVTFEDYHLFRSESRILTGVIPITDH
ncbi:MAG: hypothetical protein ABSD67_03395 [Terracidiphilus sp.]